MIKLAPLNNIAHCCRSLKIHKENMPLRPIFTGYRSLTAPVEEYLKDIFEPLLENCDYLLKSTKDFKNQFWQIKYILTPGPMN